MADDYLQHVEEDPGDKLAREHFKSIILQLQSVVEQTRLLRSDVTTFLAARRKLMKDEHDAAAAIPPVYASMPGEQVSTTVSSSTEARQKLGKLMDQGQQLRDAQASAAITAQEQKVAAQKAQEVREAIYRDREAIEKLDHQTAEARELKSKYKDMSLKIDETVFNGVVGELAERSYWPALIEDLEIATSLCWGTRIASNSRILATEKSNAQREIVELNGKLMSMAAENRVLNPYTPTSPGDLIRCSVNSVKEARKKLALLLEEESQLPADAKTAGALVVLDTRTPQKRRESIDEKQLALQLSFRMIEEDKDFENELGPMKADTPKLKGFFHHSHVGQQHVRPRLPYDVSGKFARTFTQQSKQQQEIDTQNSREEFRGYVTRILRRLAGLRIAAKMEYQVIPGGCYKLGRPNAEEWSTILPIPQTTDRASRYDRRTQLWLMMQSASQEDSRIELPLHHMYSTASREVNVPPMFVSREPMTRRQFRGLMEDRRFRKELSAVVSDKFIEGYFGKRLRFWPTFVAGTMHNYMEDWVPCKETDQQDEPDAAYDEENDLLEVPYFVAEKICNALGGVVCPVDVWEAAMRGVEGVSFLFTEDDVAQTEYNPEDPDRARLLVQTMSWDLDVDEHTRVVKGKSTRLRNMDAFKKKESPAGLRHVIRHGCEWNSVWSTTIPASAPRSQTRSKVDDTQLHPHHRPSWAPDSLKQVPRTHVLRSTSDYNTQVLLDGTVTMSYLHDVDKSRFVLLQDAHYAEGIPLLRAAGCPVKVTDDVALNHYRNAESFIGPALHTFAAPNRGIPAAAFRVAFPCNSDADDWLRRQRQASHDTRGLNLRFTDIVAEFGTPKEEMKILQNCAVEDVSHDAFYEEEILMFLAAGFDLKFAKEEPKMLVAIVIHTALSLDAVPIVERGNFATSVCTDHTSMFYLPELRGAGWNKWLKEQLSVQNHLKKSGYLSSPESKAVTTETQLFFVDTVTYATEPYEKMHNVELHFALTSVLPKVESGGKNGNDSNITTQKSKSPADENAKKDLSQSQLTEAAQSNVAVTRIEVRWIRGR